MPKQLLYYENVVPVSAKRHRQWSLEKRAGYEFASHSNAVPLSAAEFAAAAAEYVIVFTRSGGATTSPAVVLGLKPEENLYLDHNKAWKAQYVPAFVRRYPFVFSTTDDANRFMLCIDEKYRGWNQEGRGSRLFDAHGEATEYLDRMLNFVQEYQKSVIATRAFCQKLEELELLVSMAAQFRLPSGEKAQLTGIMAVDREKLKALAGEKLADLAKTNELELIYLHLQSLRNLGRVLNRFAENLSVNDPLAALSDSDADSALH